MKVRKVTYIGAVKIWKDKTAMNHLREMLLARDHCCLACGRTPQDVIRDKGKNPLTIAHYYSRHWLGTRYCFFNCCILCMSCHTGHFGWEYDKQGVHRDWMIAQYGEDFLIILYQKARQEPLKRNVQIMHFMDQYKEWRKTGMVTCDYLHISFSQGMTTAAQAAFPGQAVGALDG